MCSYRGFEIVKNAELLFSATKAGRPVGGGEGAKGYGVENQLVKLYGPLIRGDPAIWLMTTARQECSAESR
jgi:hypothetical protein